MAGAATQIYSLRFDADFLQLSSSHQARVEEKIDDLGRRLDKFPHYRMTGTDVFRLRVGDYRIIYRFDLTKNELYLGAVGHRREIYRK